MWLYVGYANIVIFKKPHHGRSHHRFEQFIQASCRQRQSDNHIEQILNCKFVTHVRTLKKGICKRTFGLM